jgi:hypothetical protein
MQLTLKREDLIKLLPTYISPSSSLYEYTKSCGSIFDEQIAWDIDKLMGLSYQEFEDVFLGARSDLIEKNYEPYSFKYEGLRNLIGTVIIKKYFKTRFEIIYFEMRKDHDLCWIHLIGGCTGEAISFKDLLQNYMFEDGIPCGILVEE